MKKIVQFLAVGCLIALTSHTVSATERDGDWRNQEGIFSKFSGVVQDVLMRGEDSPFRRIESTGWSDPLDSSTFPNIRANQDLSGLSQNETSISINPLNFSNLVGGWNDYRLSETEDVKIGYGYSMDGGLTWGDGVLTGFPTYDAQGDPAMAFDRTGKVFCALIAFDRSMIDNGVYVSVSSDGGQNWGSPVPINVSGSEEFNDKPYIAVDITNSPFKNNVYVTWTIFGWEYPIYLSRSTNGGASFSSPVRVSGSDYTQGSIPVVGPGGGVFVAWIDYATGNQLKMNASYDGGLSFEPDRTIANITPLPSSLNPGFRVNSFPIMAADISNGPNRGNLYTCWGDNRNGDADIYFTRSTNDGVNWSSPIRVNDDAVSNGRDQWFPWLSMDANGNVVVIFMDRRNDASNLYYDIYLARSVDGGLTFEDNVLVTTASSDPRTDFGGTFIGDYNGVASTFDTSYPLWCDTRNGEQDAYVAIVPTAPDNAVIDVDLFPDATTIPQGGSLTGSVTIANLTGSSQEFDPLVEIRLPNGSMMVYANPGVLSLPPGGTLDKDITIPVPVYAPVGSYMLKATLYDVASGGAKAMDYFSFEVTP
jgi:hypothetical protein